MAAKTSNCTGSQTGAAPAGHRQTLRCLVPVQVNKSDPDGFSFTWWFQTMGRAGSDHPLTNHVLCAIMVLISHFAGEHLHRTLQVLTKKWHQVASFH